MTDDLPNVMRAVRELRAEYRDIEVLRLQRRCQELHAENRELRRERDNAQQGRDEMGRAA